MTPIKRQPGFSLLEMLVAISILALALGSLYQAASGATRNVRTSERYAYGVELARSLLADHAMVDSGGVNTAGETAGGYQWRVQSQLRDLGRGDLRGVQLHDLEVGVAWFDGSKRREIVLNSVVEAYSRERR
ncbi:prepilin-type N-terminal cleavage/methylation domain-containing protein [Seongchinamella sediminis]|uniref:Prepilin-type N-terminal cleavage/methylation domain-containing protein n=1 Tax=Seongchinamella sediminis TaxID=2283635 RepID=A0A3L7E4V5_9GAMM|nr:prepilin-type N-terminal cleavage/methylation domain-containing protein [Seongchinamella sediminis]RLQ23683.1 prepilin-type N-terminal cleavage/methylation domain-containing protein [Seongchinamella sediminis]